MNTLRICIVEDEAIIAESLSDILDILGYSISGIASSYKEAIEFVDKNETDLFLLDITLKGSKSGIDLARYINEHSGKPFIFLTANSDKQTIDLAKDVSPAAYLMKPFSRIDLYSAIEIAAHNFNNRINPIVENNFIFIKHSDNYLKLYFSDIVHIESEHIYIFIHSKNGNKFILRKTLSGFLDTMLPDYFVRIHRGYVININHIKAVNPTHVIMNNEMTLSLGRVYKESLFSVLGLKQ
jgi:DNA-binding LytR/AlgR family response regulator